MGDGVTGKGSPARRTREVWCCARVCGHYRNTEGRAEPSLNWRGDACSSPGEVAIVGSTSSEIIGQAISISGRLEATKYMYQLVADVVAILDRWSRYIRPQALHTQKSGEQRKKHSLALTRSPVARRQQKRSPLSNSDNDDTPLPTPDFSPTSILNSYPIFSALNIGQAL
ncbi:hypothetical protein BGX38DRAFT_1140161 [Terfezia claveryi]|nr:hypothetical protein BGX38DRAFT_1140161 [Terfezia claveryi]